MAIAYVSPRPQFKTKIATVKDVLTLDAFNAMEEADANTSSSNSCNNASMGTAFIKNVVRQIKAGGKPIEINFFMDAFGYTPRSVEAKEVYNRYVTDLDYNVIAAAPAVGASKGAKTKFQLLRAQHSGDGTKSYPVKGYILVDKDNNIVYQITDVDTTNPFAHLVEIAPWDADVTVNIRAGVKYFVSPARPVPGYSTPAPTNDIQTIGYVQKLNPFRFRKDWRVTLDLLRGYKDKFRFQVKFDYQGNPIDAWDAYEAVRSREGLQLNMNAISMFASPITNPILLSGLDVVTDSIHTGYYGLIPTLQSSAQVIDFSPAQGFNLKSDLEPFILFQDSLKRCNRFMVKHGKAFKAGLIDSTNQLIKQDGQTLYNFDMYNRTGDSKATIEKYGIDAYTHKGLNFHLDFMEWSPMSDSRLIGTEKLNNMAIFIATDGTVDAETNSPVAPIEFFQYGLTETGDYIESIINEFKITGTEAINGNHAQSICMAVHSPEMHLIANPVNNC
jgi:hypothetical protein